MGGGHEIINLRHEPNTDGEEGDDVGQDLESESELLVVNVGTLLVEHEDGSTTRDKDDGHVKLDDQVSLQAEHGEGGIATLIQIINEVGLEEWKSLEGSQGDQSAYCIGKVGAEWSTVHTVQSLN